MFVFACTYLHMLVHDIHKFVMVRQVK